jgi:hypothetical protein
MTNSISDKIILQVIEKGLSSLGETPKQAIWFCLENEFNVNRQQVPENLEALQQALQKLFGLGYDFLDALFCKLLSDATGEDLDNYSSFTEYVASLRKK